MIHFRSGLKKKRSLPSWAVEDEAGNASYGDTSPSREVPTRRLQPVSSTSRNQRRSDPRRRSVSLTKLPSSSTRGEHRPDDVTPNDLLPNFSLTSAGQIVITGEESKRPERHGVPTSVAPTTSGEKTGASSSTSLQRTKRYWVDGKLVEVVADTAIDLFPKQPIDASNGPSPAPRSRGRSRSLIRLPSATDDPSSNPPSGSRPVGPIDHFYNPPTTSGGKTGASSSQSLQRTKRYWVDGKLVEVVADTAIDLFPKQPIDASNGPSPAPRSRGRSRSLIRLPSATDDPSSNPPSGSRPAEPMDPPRKRFSAVRCRNCHSKFKKIDLDMENPKCPTCGCFASPSSTSKGGGRNLLKRRKKKAVSKKKVLVSLTPEESSASPATPTSTDTHHLAPGAYSTMRNIERTTENVNGQRVAPAGNTLRPTSKALRGGRGGGAPAGPTSKALRGGRGGGAPAADTLRPTPKASRGGRGGGAPAGPTSKALRGGRGGARGLRGRGGARGLRGRAGARGLRGRRRGAGRALEARDMTNRRRRRSRSQPPAWSRWRHIASNHAELHENITNTLEKIQESVNGCPIVSSIPDATRQAEGLGVLLDVLAQCLEQMVRLRETGCRLSAFDSSQVKEPILLEKEKVAAQLREGTLQGMLEALQRVLEEKNERLENIISNGKRKNTPFEALPVPEATSNACIADGVPSAPRSSQAHTPKANTRPRRSSSVGALRTMTSAAQAEQHKAFSRELAAAAATAAAATTNTTTTTNEARETVHGHRRSSSADAAARSSYYQMMPTPPEYMGLLSIPLSSSPRLPTPPDSMYMPLEPSSSSVDAACLDLPRPSTMGLPPYPPIEPVDTTSLGLRVAPRRRSSSADSSWSYEPFPVPPADHSRGHHHHYQQPVESSPEHPTKNRGVGSDASSLSPSTGKPQSSPKHSGRRRRFNTGGEKKKWFGSVAMRTGGHTRGDTAASPSKTMVEAKSPEKSHPKNVASRSGSKFAAMRLRKKTSRTLRRSTMRSKGKERPSAQTMLGAFGMVCSKGTGPMAEPSNQHQDDEILEQGRVERKSHIGRQLDDIFDGIDEIVDRVDNVLSEESSTKCDSSREQSIGHAVTMHPSRNTSTPSTTTTNDQETPTPALTADAATGNTVDASPRVGRPRVSTRTRRALAVVEVEGSNLAGLVESLIAPDSEDISKIDLETLANGF